MGSDLDQRHPGQSRQSKQDENGILRCPVFLSSLVEEAAARQCCIYNVDLLVDTEQNLLHLVYVIAHE